MLLYSWVGALETRNFGKCGIKAELIPFAINALLTLHLFMYNNKWTQSRDLWVSWEDCFDTVYWHKLESLEMPLLTSALELKLNDQCIGQLREDICNFSFRVQCSWKSQGGDGSYILPEMDIFILVMNLWNEPLNLKFTDVAEGWVGMFSFGHGAPSWGKAALTGPDLDFYSAIQLKGAIMCYHCSLKWVPVQLAGSELNWIAITHIKSPCKTKS